MNSPKTDTGAPTEPQSQIVINASQGFGYTYSNLADIAKAGFKIPPMKTARVDGYEYVFALINGEWIQGAQVIDMDMKGMNAAQAYGSALTYARRYTVQLVLGIACDDDDKVEADGAERRKAGQSSKPTRNYEKLNIDFNDLRDQLAILDDVESVKELYKSLHVEKMSPAQQNYINKIVNERKKQLEK